MLINKQAIKLHIRYNKKVRIASDFYPALERKLKEIIDIALKNNGRKSTLTDSELMSGKDFGITPRETK